MRMPNLKAEREAAQAEADVRVDRATESRHRQLRRQLFPGIPPGDLNVAVLSSPELKVIAANAGKKSTLNVLDKEGKAVPGQDQDTVDFLLAHYKDTKADDLKALQAAIKAEQDSRGLPREIRATA